MKRPSLPFPRRDGFSLIVTVAMLVILTVIAVGLLSLSAISLKSVTLTSAQQRAQANARMALMMAIDKLQAQLGPDQRISANASILSTSPVANPHWLGVWDSWRAGDGTFDRYPDAISSHSTVYTGGRGDPIPDSLHPTYEPNRQGHFREWLVSVDPNLAGNINVGRTMVLNAGYMPSEAQDAVILVGEGTLGGNAAQDEFVRASLVPVDAVRGASPTGRYGWWVGDESQKGSILRDPYENRNDLTLADRLFRMQAAGSMGTQTVEELENITNRGKDQLGNLVSLKSLDLVDGATKSPPRAGRVETGPSARFHDLTTVSRAVLADVREGGLKRDLSTLLERPIVPLASESGVSDINDFMLYRFTAKDGALTSTEPQEIVPIQDLAAYYQLHSRGNSPTESGVRRPDITARGVVYDSSYLNNAPHLLGVNFGTTGTSPIYTREYTTQYRHPRIVKVQLLFSMFAEERPNWEAEANRQFPLNRLNSHELLIGVTPSMTLWNPTNLPVMMQMDSDSLVANMFRMGDLPLQFRFRKEDRYGNDFTSNYVTWLNGSIAGTNDGLNLYWSGRHSVFLEPGEVKTFSLPYSGDLSSLKSQMGYRGHWNQGWSMSSFFMKTDEYFEGHEVREGWEPESFILMPGSATGASGPDPLPGQPDMRDIVNNRLRFKRADRITIDIACNSGNDIVNLGAKQSSYQRFDGNGISGTTSWDRSYFTISSYTAGQSGREPAQGFNRQLFALGMPGGQDSLSSPSRTGSSIIGRSRFAAGWPFLQYSLMAASETSEASNSGIMGGRKTASRPFLHSSPMSGSPFLHGNTGEALYNFGWNWSANLINDVFEAPVQLNRDNQSYYGGGYTAESGTTHVIQQEIPITPPISIASLSHARLGGHSLATEDGMPYGNNPGQIRHFSASARRTVLGRAVGYGGLLPYTLQAIGNSYAHPSIPADQTHKTIRRNLHYQVGLIDETFADHSYLANKALWDEFFFSSITPQPSEVEVFETSRTAQEVAEGFFFNGEDLPNTRMTPHLSDLDQSKLDSLFAQYDDFHDGLADRIAAHMMVNGPFNINSTSVDAWRILFSSLRNKPVAHIDPGDAINGRNPSVASNVRGTPVGQIGLGSGQPYTGSRSDPSDPEQWNSLRALTDNEIEELAEAMVEQVKLRGPFLSLSEFVNRRLDSSEPDLSAKGALQAALDDPGVSINSGFRRSDRRFSNSEISMMSPDFREAAEGPVAYGSAAYVDQADILRNFAAQLTPRGDTFVVRAYGDALDANGNVEARAWCEAVVQRLPDYVEPDNGTTGDQPETKYADLTSASNRNFGRKMQIVSFRWLNPSEI